MKKHLLFAGLFAFSTMANAQWNLTGNAGTSPGTNFIGTTDNVDLLFRTNNTDQMWILNTGKVGIGAATPTSQLEVSTTGWGDGIRVTQAGTQGACGLHLKNNTTGGNQWSLYSFGLNDANGAGNFGIYNWATSQTNMLINSSGNVGIGTSSPTGKVEVSTTGWGDGLRITQAGTQGACGLHLKNNTTGGNQWSLYSFGLNDANGAGNFGIYNWATSQTNLLINSSGNVGIGTSSPNASLHVGNGSANLHYGSQGILVKFNNGDRSLMEFHSPDGANRLVFQTLTGASYLTSLDNKPLLLQTGQGNAAIGSDYAPRKLTVNGSIGIGQGYSGSGIGPNGLEIMVNGEIPVRRGISTPSDPNGAFNFYIHGWQNNAMFDFKEGSSNSSLMRILVNGQVQIGNPLLASSPHFSDSKLTVKGKAVFQEVIVTQQNWADYVFENDYKLLSLKEVENYYKANKHLPEIPSAQEIAESGISIGEMNKLLLQKIEELTIYVVEQQKQLDEQKKLIEKIIK